MSGRRRERNEGRDGADQLADFAGIFLIPSALGGSERRDRKKMATVHRASAAATTPALALTGGAVDGAGSRTHQRGKRGDGATVTTMGVGEFVEASFASFERAFPGSSAASNAGVKATVRVEGSLAGDAAGGGEDQPASEDGAVAATEGSFADEDEESDDDALLDRASFLTLLTTLYLPLLLLWLRRSMFGTASLLRSLLIGHALRLLLAYAIVLPDAPPAWAADLGGRVRKSILWKYVMGLGVFLADAILGPEDGAGGALGVGSEGGRHHRGGETWPPPALTALAVITVMAFVVHPEGLTWVVLGKIRDGVRYSFGSLALGFDMIQDGTIPTLAASGSLAGLVLLAGIVHRTLTSKHKSHAPAPERSRQKGKKGKKGRGRHGGGGASRGGAQARGRGRIRGGHYRSTKELAKSPPRNASKSRSRSRSRSRSSSPPPLTETEPRNRIESDSTISVLEEAKSQHPSDDVGSSPPAKEQPQSAEVQFGGHRKETPSRRACDKPAAQSQISPTAPISSSGVNRCSAPDGTVNRKSHEISGKSGGPSGGGRSGRRRRRGKKGRGGCADKGTKPESRETMAAAGVSQHGDRLHPPPPPTSVVIAPPKSALNSCLPGVSPYSQSYVTEPTPPPSPQLSLTASPYEVERRNYSEAAVSTQDHDSATMSFFSSASPPLLPTNQRGTVNPQRRLQPIGSPPTQLSTSSVTDTSQQYVQAAFGSGHSQPLYRSASMPTEHRGLYGLRNSPSELVDLAMPTQTNSVATAGVIGGNSSALRYNVPNYASTYSYSQGSGRYTPGKNELAAFLAQVGLVGTACAAILEDLSDVDALSQLSKEKYESYHIGDAKQAEISIMLDARFRRLTGGNVGSKLQAWNAAVVRPPPGLENVCRESPGTVGTNAAFDGGQQQQHLPLFASSTLPSCTGSSSGAGFVLPGMGVNLSDSRARCDTGESWASSCDDATKVATPSPSPLPRPFTHVEDLVEEVLDDDSKIEADLQELGGQMVGSILDF